MAVSLWRYAGDITSSYDGKNLQMAVEKAGALSMDKYPIKMTDAQFAAVARVQQVFNYLAGTVASPTQLAGVKVDDSIVIREIHARFHRSKADYMSRFAASCRSDETKIRELEAYSDWTVCAIFQWIARCFNGHTREVQLAGSAHRYAWLIQVGTLEEERLKEAREMIETRSRTLIAELQGEQGIGFGNRDFNRELGALARLFKVVVPGKELVVDEVNVQNFLQSLSA